jgi:hypothetical protein
MLKIYSPGYNTAGGNNKFVPLLQYALKEGTSECKILQELNESDIILPAFYVENYVLEGKAMELEDFESLAIKHRKPLVLFTGGDFGITPKNIVHYHLYRMGGYRSRNKGNQFALPCFFGDPVVEYLNNELNLISKRDKPIIGFCGQGKAGLKKWGIDVSRSMLRGFLSYLGTWSYDVEKLTSAAYTRSKMLDQLERSSLVETRFIRHRRYRAGAKTKAEKEIGNKIFFDNMKLSQYMLCYRGGGNFSVRLYQSLACGRIPVVVESDNNFPLPEMINWKRFPVVKFKDRQQVDSILVKFHRSHSEASFAELQQYARYCWENFLSFDGNMKVLLNQYQSN